MDELSQSSPVFTGLIVLTGTDAPGLARGLFQALADFSIQIDDVEQIVISHRLVLTVLITLNPAHQKAIENDLAEYAESSGTDVATIFSAQTLVPVEKNRVAVHIASKKMHPRILLVITEVIVSVNGNIEAISRTQNAPTGILFEVTGTTAKALSSAIESLEFEDELETRVYEL